VDFALMTNAVNRFKSAEKAMKGFTTRLEAVSNQINRVTQVQSFQDNIKERAKALGIISDSIRDSGICLGAIQTEYYEAEKKVNLLTVIIDWFRRLFGKGKKSDDTERGGGCAIPKVIPIPIPLPIPKPPQQRPPQQSPPQQRPPPQQKPPPGTFTDAEREADMRMQRDARAIEQKYLPQWRAARTVEQKQAVLTNMLAELQAIMGTNANPQIDFVRVGAREYAGLYRPGTHTIVINMNHAWFNSPDALGVLMHEVRHAYQAEATGLAPGHYNPNHIVSPERAQIWRDTWRAGNFDTICADARWFSGGR